MNQLEFKKALRDAITIGESGVDVVWAVRTDLKTEWLKYENYQRVIFQLYADGKITERQTLILLSELLGSQTGRGVGFYNLN